LFPPMQTQYQTKPHDFGVWGTAPGGKGELHHPQRKKQIMQQAVPNAATNAGLIYARFLNGQSSVRVGASLTSVRSVARFLSRTHAAAVAQAVIHPESQLPETERPDVRAGHRFQIVRSSSLRRAVLRPQRGEQCF